MNYPNISYEILRTYKQNDSKKMDTNDPINEAVVFHLAYHVFGSGDYDITPEDFINYKNSTDITTKLSILEKSWRRIDVFLHSSVYEPAIKQLFKTELNKNLLFFDNDSHEFFGDTESMLPDFYLAENTNIKLEAKYDRNFATSEFISCMYPKLTTEEIANFDSLITQGTPFDYYIRSNGATNRAHQANAVIILNYNKECFLLFKDSMDKFCYRRIGKADYNF